MLVSLLKSNPDCLFDVYLLNTSVTFDDTALTRRLLSPCGNLILVNADDIKLEGAPTTSRYPKEIYYRIFAARYLPKSLDRVLYLDPDLIVNGSVKELYSTNLDNYFFAAASHTGSFLTTFNSLRLDMDENSPYINSGVMLMNLERLRREQNYEEVFDFIEKRKKLLLLPDQDIISSLYGSKIYALDTFRYNMTERLYKLHSPFEKELDLDWVRSNSVIIHYCGKNKPWKDNYFGELNVFYNEAAALLSEMTG